LTVLISATTNGETSRYALFVQAFNLALDLLAGLDVPLNPPQDDPLMFHRNDPKDIVGYHEMEESRRKPEVVMGNEEALSRGHEEPDTLHLSDIRGLAPQAPPLPFRWLAVKSSVEFQATVGFMKKPLMEYTYSPHPGPATMPNIPTDIYEPTTPTSPITYPSMPPPQAQCLSESFWPFSVTCKS